MLKTFARVSHAIARYGRELRANKRRRDALVKKLNNPELGAAERLVLQVELERLAPIETRPSPAHMKAADSPNTRQRRRAQLRAAKFKQVKGGPRHERRQLSRALAASVWKHERAAELARIREQLEAA